MLHTVNDASTTPNAHVILKHTNYLVMGDTNELIPHYIFTAAAYASPVLYNHTYSSEVILYAAATAQQHVYNNTITFVIFTQIISCYSM